MNNAPASFAKITTLLANSNSTKEVACTEKMSYVARQMTKDPNILASGISKQHDADALGIKCKVMVVCENAALLSTCQKKYRTALAEDTDRDGRQH